MEAGHAGDLNENEEDDWFWPVFFCLGVFSVISFVDLGLKKSWGAPQADFLCFSKMETFDSSLFS